MNINCSRNGKNKDRRTDLVLFKSVSDGEVNVVSKLEGVSSAIITRSGSSSREVLFQLEL